MIPVAAVRSGSNSSSTWYLTFWTAGLKCGLIRTNQLDQLLNLSVIPHYRPAPRLVEVTIYCLRGRLCYLYLFLSLKWHHCKIISGRKWRFLLSLNCQWWTHCGAIFALFAQKKAADRKTNFWSAYTIWLCLFFFLLLQILFDPSLVTVHRENRLTWPEPRSWGSACWEERAVNARFFSEQHCSVNIQTESSW